jgi:hypothetical protein
MERKCKRIRHFGELFLDIRLLVWHSAMIVGLGITDGSDIG